MALALGLLEHARGRPRAEIRRQGLAVLVAVGFTGAIVRPFLIGWIAERPMGNELAQGVVLVIFSLVVDAILVGVGSVMMALEEERARAVARATRIERAERMERLGLMAGSVAHDINNVLTAVMSGVDLARDPRATPAEVREELDALQGATRRSCASGLGSSNSATRSASRSARRTRSTSGSSPVPTSRSASMRPGRERPHGVFLVRPGRWMVLRIADHGPGFPAEALDKVFEPFYSTKGERGTGLGLATVFAVARDAGGAVHAFNAPEGGAVIECWFPVIAA